MRHYVVVSYLSKFTQMRVLEYTQKLCNEEKKTYAILTNEAGIQGILDRIGEDEKTKDYTVDVFYFQSDEVTKCEGKREKFLGFYENYKSGVVQLDSYVNALKEDVPVLQEETPESSFNESVYYEKRVKHFAKMRKIENINVKPIRVSENTNLIEANKTQIQKLVNELNILKETYSARDCDLSIYIDSSGGPRDFSFLCIMLIKLLQFKNYDVRNIIYSNINSRNGNEISSINSTYEMLDIINGVSEFTNYGRVKILRDSLGRKKKEEEDLVENLLKSMESYSQMLSVCDFEKLDETFKNIETAMNEINNSDLEGTIDSRIQIVKMQFPFIKEKMGINDTKTQFLKLLNNYIENDMLQQAVTFYNERMPEYIQKELRVLNITIGLSGKYSNESAEKFKMNKLLHGFSGKKGDALENEFVRRDTTLRGTKKFAGGIYALKNITNMREVSFPYEHSSEVIELVKDILVIQELRNHMNHASEESLTDIMNQKAREFYGVILTEKTTLYELVKQRLKESVERLEKLKGDIEHV